MNIPTRIARLSPLVLLSILLSPASAQSNKTIVFLSPQPVTQGYTKTILDLSQAYTKQKPGVKVQYQNADQTQLQQQLERLGAADNLPTLFSAPANTQTVQLAQKGLLVDIEATFKKLGIYNQLNPAAVSINKQLFSGKLIALPLELNIEGFWYNKKLFADNGVKEPKTWNELVTAAEKFKQKGIQPFSASGEQKWPLTRLIGNYAARKYGSDVMQRVAKGQLKLTDAGFVEAATAVADLGKKGYFGLGVNTIDYQTALDTFMQGKAAMLYMGSWALGNFNDPKQNKIGNSNIGFFNFPTVQGGKGTLNDWNMNTGLVVAISQKQNDAALQAWMKSVFSNFGNKAFAEQGLITGFKVTQRAQNVPALTTMVQQKINSAKSPFLFFEALFGPKAFAVSLDNVQPLITGDMSPQDYLRDLQAAQK
ncbi:ABC transporter substrate-binding protein [Deinococcus sp. QL22]|uniref:ABC transporter substrate-binding protein n=1 Tax=Deinococcus sp. QL22 TaxID=2939437 RepID=UPI002016CE6B|nr:extracellular solute-binding protein [Deinococcus sp. QL22]UQN09164.1 extracellular solute-binding protein [Deinococcus sp. QL22]